MADMNICPDCEETVVRFTFHPGCCPHEHVDDVELVPFGGARAWCLDCGSVLQGDESGWEVA